MVKRLAAIGCTAAMVAGYAARNQTAAAQASPQPTSAGQLSPAPAGGPTAQRALLDRYCVSCHSQKAKAAGQEPARKLTVDDLDVTRIADQPEAWERIVRKMRAGMMPPSGSRRPEKPAYDGFVASIEAELDKQATPYAPPPGLHRLNRTEYANVIHDILNLDVDAASYLPSDDSTHGFDNVAGALGISSTLVEAYMSAAGKISRLAIGEPAAARLGVYPPPEDTSHDHHPAGPPLRPRGRMRAQHAVTS